MARRDGDEGALWGGPADMTDWEAVMWRGEADRRTRSSGALVEVLDCEPDWDRLLAAHRRVTQRIPRLRDRVVEPLWPVVPPAWSPDPQFDLQYHLQRVRLPAPGGLGELLEMTGHLLSRPFDRARPPWEALLVEGLEGGRAAYVFKMHHSLTDGQGLVQLLDLGHSRTREPSAAGAVERPRSRQFTPMTLMATRTMRTMTSGPVHFAHRVGGSAKLLARTLTNPMGVAADTMRYTRSLQRVLTPPPAERSPLLRGDGCGYRLLAHDVPLAELRAAGKAAGGSVNDAFLAALLGGFRRYHEHFRVTVERMPMGLPVSLRRSDDPLGGNRFAGARFAAPVGEPDPGERIRAVREFVLHARAEPAIAVLDVLAPVMSRLPRAVMANLAAGATRALDFQASNVAGLGHPVYLSGARVTHTYAFGPRPGVAAMVTMLSYDGTCCLGFNIDPDAISDPDLFSECIRGGFDEVIALGQPS